MHWKATKRVINGIEFDSIFESEVYKRMHSFIRVKGFNIDVHCKVPVFPKTSNYKPEFWRIDFCLKNGNNYLFIEAKGQPQTHQRLKHHIRGLDLFNKSVHDNLLIVLPDSQKKELSRLNKTIKVPVIHLAQLNNFLKRYFFE